MIKFGTYSDTAYQLRLAASALVLAITSAGCVSNYGFVPEERAAQTNSPVVTPGPSPMAGLDNFSPPAVANSGKVDMVFVVDNSGSMGDNQVKLRDSMQSFIDQFVMRSVDWKISLISTDINADGTHWTNGSGPYAGYINPKRGEFLSRYAGVSFLACDSNSVCNTTDVVNKFKANVALGTGGSGNENGIQSLLYATESAKLSGANAGFFRADSYKAAIIISDENEGLLDDSSPAEITEADARIASITSRMQSLGTGGYGLYFVNDLKATLANNSDGDGVNQYPAFYKKLANATGSLMLDITDSNWGDQLVQVGDDIISTAQGEFKLSKLPISGSIKVYIDNVLVAQDNANGWKYNAAPKNSIELNGMAKANAAGHALKVEYQYNP